MKPVKWFLAFLKRYRVHLILGMILTIFSTVLSIVNPYISGMIVDDVISGGQYRLLFPLVGLMLFVVVIRNCIRFFYQLVFAVQLQISHSQPSTADCFRKILPSITRNVPVTS